MKHPEKLLRVNITLERVDHQGILPVRVNCRSYEFVQIFLRQEQFLRDALPQKKLAELPDIMVIVFVMHAVNSFYSIRIVNIKGATLQLYHGLSDNTMI